MQSSSFDRKIRNDVFVCRSICFIFFKPDKISWHLRSCVMHLW